MKFLTNKSTIKKVIIAILLVMTINFISPITTHADFGGALFTPISQFICAVADLVLEGLQDIFIGTSSIDYPGPPDSDMTIFAIKYSPGIIFSGNVPGLKTNFINTSEDEREEKAKDVYYKYTSIASLKVKSMDEYADAFINPGKYGDVTEGYEIDPNAVICYVLPNKSATDNAYDESTLVVTWVGNDPVSGKTVRYFGISRNVYLTEEDVLNHAIWTAGGAVLGFGVAKAGAAIGTAISPGLGTVIGGGIGLLGTLLIHAFNTSKDTDFLEIEIYKATMVEKEAGTRKSSAYILQDTVATWYKALRAITLVGLLSILVYVGIRILISSTGKEKAKYKKMIMDWLVAICILFILQYIMIFITEIAQRISNILSVSVVGELGEDTFITNVRSSVGASDNFTGTFFELLLYLVLVIYTVVFTVQYLKRLIYMAFLTLIAPLIALTYPLDKIKDGQAQAFTMWIREYTFNALLQPMHLLLYYIFISSATSLVDLYPVYAVVAIGFLMPAEKFFRKMFGFEKSSSASQMGAAAGGALIMNAINKMGKGGGKHAAGGKGGAEGAEGSGGNSTPRYVPSPNTSGGGPEASANEGASGNPGGGTGGSPSSSGARGTSEETGTNGSARTAFGQTINPASAGGVSLKNGARTLKGHYFNKANGKKLAKGAGRLIRKGAIGLAGAATLGTVGLAAGIATGDAGNAFKYGLAGAGAGYMGANALGDKALEFEKKNREIFKEGALGTEEYNTRNSIKELTNDNDFNNVCKHLGVKSQEDKEHLIRQFRSNGITSSADIKKAMNAGASTNNRDKDQIIAAAKIRKQATQYGMKRKEIEEMIKSQPNISDENVKKAMDLIDML